MMEQLSMFSMMEVSGRQAALDWLLGFLRDDYFEYVEDRAQLLRDGEDAGRLMTMEEYAEDLFRGHAGWYGLDGAFDSFQFHRAQVVVKERGSGRTYEFSKTQIIREI